jgi:putative hemolysin
MLTIEIVIVVVLVVFNGLLSMSEMAIVSSRRARLKAMADGGSRGARKAIELANAPGRFLSTVQIGITLVGVFAGAFSGATLSDRLAGYLTGFGFSNETADSLALALVVAGITYLSLVVGELVPKRIALRSPERVAAMAAEPMRLLSWIATPLVVILDLSRRRRPPRALGRGPRGAPRGPPHRRGAGRRAAHDQRRDAPCRPQRARHHDAALGRRLGRHIGQ